VTEHALVAREFQLNVLPAHRIRLGHSQENLVLAMTDILTMESPHIVLVNLIIYVSLLIFLLKMCRRISLYLL
jgi:hypothetical protein